MDKAQSTNPAGPTPEPATPEDQVVVGRQIGRDPRALAGVAARCPFGHPAVTAQSTTDADGRPFPTAYYATCPRLVRQIDRLESKGGVRRFEGELADDSMLATQTLRAHEQHLQLHGHNIAGIVDVTRVKCLHAHAAFALAGGEHPLGLEVLREASPIWCDDNTCGRDK